MIADGNIFRVMDSVATWMSGKDQKPSLLLYGGVGSGKTTMAMAIGKAVGALSKTAKGGAVIVNNVAQVGPFAAIPSPFFMSASDIVLGSAQDGSLIKSLIVKGLLIIDDLGCEPVSAKSFGTETTPLATIIAARYNALAPTIITTNIDQKDLVERYGIRIYDRMLETYELIAFDNKSYRR